MRTDAAALVDGSSHIIDFFFDLHYRFSRATFVPVVDR